MHVGFVLFFQLLHIEPEDFPPLTLVPRQVVEVDAVFLVFPVGVLLFAFLDLDLHRFLANDVVFLLLFFRNLLFLFLLDHFQHPYSLLIRQTPLNISSQQLQSLLVRRRCVRLHLLDNHFFFIPSLRLLKFRNNLVHARPCTLTQVAITIAQIVFSHAKTTAPKGRLLLFFRLFLNHLQGDVIIFSRNRLYILRVLCRPRFCPEIPKTIQK